MVFKYLCVLACISLALGAPKRSTASEPNERVAAYYVKDNDSGELRFLTSGVAGGNNANSALNQFITQKQDLLEQLRPTSNLNNGFTGTGTGGFGTGGFGTGGFGTGGFGGTGTTGGVSPIVINLGNPAGTGGNNNNPAIGASPIVDLLPQIIAQGALGGNRRRVGGNRRRVVAVPNQRRRPNRGGNKKNKNNVYVIRPREI